jgi:hypothetical protein
MFGKKVESTFKGRKSQKKKEKEEEDQNVLLVKA